MIRNAMPADAEAICRIYNPYVEKTAVTFEETPLTPEQMSARIQSYGARLPWLVFEEEGEILGYAYAASWKERSAYRHSVETSVYLAEGARGRRLGSLLYRELFDRLRELSIHAVIAGIALPNPESIALHEKFGFRQVAHFREVGRKFDRWIDLGYWQLIL